MNLVSDLDMLGLKNYCRIRIILIFEPSSTGPDHLGSFESRLRLGYFAIPNSHIRQLIPCSQTICYTLTIYHLLETRFYNLKSNRVAVDSICRMCGHLEQIQRYRS